MMIGLVGLIASIGLDFLTRIRAAAAALAEKTFGYGKRGKLCGCWLDSVDPLAGVPPWEGRGVRSPLVACPAVGAEAESSPSCIEFDTQPPTYGG